MKEAVIFDMDGVISDTQKFHAETESMLLKRFGIEITPDEISDTYAGVREKIMFAELFSKHHVVIDSLEDIVREKWEIMSKIVKGRIAPISFALELIEEFKAEGFKLAVASGSTKAFIHEVLETLNIQQHFEAIVSAEEVIHGKPAPDIFFLAAARLGVQPERALVIEDGRNGMIAAKRANMLCIGLVKDIHADYPADILVQTLNEISAKELKNH